MLKVIYLGGKENIGKTRTLFEFSKLVEAKYKKSIVDSQIELYDTSQNEFLSVVDVEKYFNQINCPNCDIKCCFKIKVDSESLIVIVTTHGDYKLSRDNNLDFFNRVCKKLNIGYDNKDKVVWFTACRTSGYTNDCGVLNSNPTYIIKDYVNDYDKTKTFDVRLASILNANMANSLLEIIKII